ncbi:hypothetical protein M404DRAFT_993118 [Pisolithus tinctorius Marx 270]|uniref:Uncharacterized protein n=1 Tax=Pisolithus tinctorius Marx 270 TaxID=870435 RepID=A0A0C3PW66_PISTI|nr:hypothetical protein M404DRAFT_993118 [Pisolithus tinctorius Marx 270]
MDNGDRVLFAAGNEVHMLDCNMDISLQHLDLVWMGQGWWQEVRGAIERWEGETKLL